MDPRLDQQHKKHMENKNLVQNLYLKQFNQSDAIAYSEEFIGGSSDYNFRLLDNAYRNTGRLYAKLKIAIETNRCESEHCNLELAQIKIIEEAPSVSLDFLSSLLSELSVTEEPSFDPNNSYKYTVANSLMSGKPGFSKSDGYEAQLNLLPDGSQQIVFMGPGFDMPLVINSSALSALLKAESSLIVSTPDINADMTRLLSEIGLFAQDMINETGLTAEAKISEEFAIKNPDGSFDYQIIDIGNGKGRNVIKYDLKKIEQKVAPFINAEVAGLMGSEQDAIAVWNVYISKDTSTEEDDQMAENAVAETSAWSYTEDLPLQQDKKVLFQIKYKKYFMSNYLKQYTTNQTPSVQEDAAVFDLAEGKKAKAQKFLDDNNLN